MFVSIEVFVKTFAHFAWFWFLIAIGAIFAVIYIYFCKVKEVEFLLVKKKLFVVWGVAVLILGFIFWGGAKSGLENWLIYCHESRGVVDPFNYNGIKDSGCPPEKRTKSMYRNLTGKEI